MDPLVQQMLSRAEKHSRELGLINVNEFKQKEKEYAALASGLSYTVNKEQTQSNENHSKTPQIAMRSNASKTNIAQVSSSTSSGIKLGALSAVSNKIPLVEKIKADLPYTNTASNKVLRQFTPSNKENVDLDIEINILTDKHVEVAVEVEEKDMTDDDIDQSSHSRGRSEDKEQPIAQIRDSSRNRLQRLGALYSNTDLSSPIHRTEGEFHAEDETVDGIRKPKQRLGKLAALADSIKQWEDDTSHYYPAVAKSNEPKKMNELIPPPKPDLPSRHLLQKDNKLLNKPKQNDDSKDCTHNNQTKQLKWDQKVINSLEAQGFQRRESSTIKFAYDYNKNDEDNANETTPMLNMETKKINNKNVKEIAKNNINQLKKTHDETDTKMRIETKKGLVSDRAAAFEQKSYTTNQNQIQQKDPTELSLKERMQLFERNKGEAILPKAAFGMAPSINQIRKDLNNRRKDNTEQQQQTKGNATKSLVDGITGKVRDRVAALVSSVSTTTTTSENRIKADIERQRQEDLQILQNRFNKQKYKFSEDKETKVVAVTKIPQPPPMPPVILTPTNTTKRRSPGDCIDDENKRPRTATINKNRLYPALSDLESNDSDMDQCEVATAILTDDHDDNEDKHKQIKESKTLNDDNESCMESDANEDSSVGICNGSLGREIMHVVQKNEQQQQQKHVKKIHKEVRYSEHNDYYECKEHHDDSSLNSSNLSGADGRRNEINDYLDLALGSDIDDDDDDDGDDDYTQESDDVDEQNSFSIDSRRLSKGTTASDSFSFRKISGTQQKYQTINEEQTTEIPMQSSSTNKTTTTTTTKTTNNSQQPITSQLSINQEDENMVTLVHTVSFYRRQQSANSANSTPIRKVCREEQVHRSNIENAANVVLQYEKQTPLQSSPEYENNMNMDDSLTSDNDNFADVADTDDRDEAYEAVRVQNKVKKLLDEVCKQQQVIAQTSQALNLCAATIEFSGSTESVEGERHLLVATHRRQACLDEVQRLRVEKSIRPLGAPKERGRLTVKGITIPLRQDYIRKLASDTISGHHIICLLKYNEHVIPTKPIPTLPGLLAVKFPDTLQLDNVYADFKVTLEIYGMTAHREVLPHEVKYHINLNKKSGIKTPKKKGNDNRLVMPPVQSPAGPNVVRTPALVQYGFAIFSLREIQRTTWSLTQMLGVSPLDGIIHMKVNCELTVCVEYKGFLTIFHEISGFGAWHRRWCYLNGTVLNYWRYPDEEKRKTPMGSIDLYSCVTQKVSVASRDICARLNTILLEIERPSQATDKPSLIIVPNGQKTIVRYLLSADKKEERDQWCAYFNKALTLLRAWGPPSSSSTPSQ